MSTITLTLPRRAQSVGNLILALLLATCVVGAAHAGSMDGFNVMIDMLEGWISGGLGKIIAIAALVIMVVACIAKSSAVPALLFIGTIVFLGGGGALIDVAFTATV